MTQTVSLPGTNNLDASNTIRVKSANLKLHNVKVKNRYGKRLRILLG
jgi:hypothetical protein